MNVKVPVVFSGDSGASFCASLIDLGDQSHRIELDMSETLVIDSSAVRALFYTVKRLRVHGCDVVISSASPEAIAYLELTRIPCYVPLPPVDRQPTSVASAVWQFALAFVGLLTPWRAR